MTGEKRIFTSFEKNDCESDYITFGENSQGKVLGFGKIIITTEHSICYLFHNFVRWVTIACSPIRVWPSLGEMMVPLPLKVS
jgi:hypothetical protein